MSGLTLDDPVMARWLAALESRYLSDLRFPEVTRALRALSAAYVERRGPRGADARSGRRVHGALDSAGKRAAFALFYGPLHFLTVRHVIGALGALPAAPAAVLDLGCGTGVAGAAWALHAGGGPHVFGLDRHPWAVAEARWTYRELGLHGTAREGEVSTLPRIRPGTAIVAGWLLNELADEPRLRLEHALTAAAERGSHVLVVEPIARSVSPWWDAAASRVRARGGREDEWRFTADLPPLLRLLDKAAGLDHRELTARTLYLPG